jgi:hypothetical protein
MPILHLWPGPFRLLQQLVGRIEAEAVIRRLSRCNKAALRVDPLAIAPCAPLSFDLLEPSHRT